MYHLKTKLGTFWVVDGHLGLEDSALGKFKTPEEAASAVSAQSTGDLGWDSQTEVCAPSDISRWTKGEPKEWRAN